MAMDGDSAGVTADCHKMEKIQVDAGRVVQCCRMRGRQRSKALMEASAMDSLQKKRPACRDSSPREALAGGDGGWETTQPQRQPGEDGMGRRKDIRIGERGRGDLKAGDHRSSEWLGEIWLEVVGCRAALQNPNGSECREASRCQEVAEVGCWFFGGAKMIARWEESSSVIMGFCGAIFLGG